MFITFLKQHKHFVQIYLAYFIILFILTLLTNTFREEPQIYNAQTDKIYKAIFQLNEFIFRLTSIVYIYKFAKYCYWEYKSEANN